MDQTKHGESCSCGCKGGSTMMLECCQEHKMSKEHLEMKKKFLEEKLEWVNGELGKL